MLTRDQLTKTQKSLYQKLQDQIRSYGLKENPDIKNYKKTFLVPTKSHFRKIDIENLIQETKRKKMIFFGDFHPFAQSQKGFLRFLKICHQNNKKLAVAMECFYSFQQAKIDAYLNGELTLMELEEEIDFQRNWPFPWESYSDILRFCKDEQIQLLAINSTIKKSKNSLRERDEFASTLLLRFQSKHRNLTILCFIGELHLGKNHLPKFFPKEQIAIIHQNLDSLYFKALKKYDNVPEVLSLGKSEYCVFNSVPWVKSQSFLDWIEGGFEDQSELDTYEQIHELSEILRNALDLKKKSNDKVELACYPERPFIDTPIDQLLFRHSNKFFRTNFLPYSKTILIPILSSNAKTEAAALLLKYSSTKTNAGKSLSNSKHLIIFQYFIGFLGSKILNPNRKCNELIDLKTILESSSRGKTVSKKAQVANQALKELKGFIPLNFKTIKTIPPSDINLIESYRMVGYILGNRYFHANKIQEKKNRKLTQELFDTNLSEQGAKLLLSKVKLVIRESRLIPKGKSKTL